MAKIKTPATAILATLLAILHAHVTAQELRQITLEDIFVQGSFYQKTLTGVNWMQDGRYYTSQTYDRQNREGLIVKYDIATGEIVETLLDSRNALVDGEPLAFDGYQMSPDESSILLSANEEAIYRRSTKADYYLYSLEDRSVKKINDEEKISYATFSPNGERVAYVRDNNLFYVDLETMTEKQITVDGEKNKIINGAADWVYEEEFQFSKAFFWSPDGGRIAFYRFDESAVPQYNMQLWGGLYPEDYEFKYPKAGEENSKVDIVIYDLETEDAVSVQFPDEKREYVPRVLWTSDPSTLAVVALNRLQNDLQIYHVDAASGETAPVLRETSDTYVDINFNDRFIYLEDGFLRTSEQDGYKHIYYHRMDGSLVRQVTKGEWEVDEFYGVDEENGLLYFSSTEISPLERHVYQISLDGKSKTKLSERSGTNAAKFSPDFKYYIHYHSSVNSPLTVTLHEAPSGSHVYTIEDNSRLREDVKKHTFGQQEFFTFKTKEDVELNGYLVKPHDFDPEKKYPVLMYVYGGPGSQLVMNEWEGSRELWHHYLSQQGYIIACIDNRGTGGRGKAFKDVAYGRLGELETTDQIEGAKYLGSLDYVDESRIGIWGWSYGGYMSSLAILLGADFFNAAIAVAPVTSWRFYDTIYTERYLKTPQLNPGGYDDYSPITHAVSLQDPYLIVHGTGDDNVHFQNTVEMTNALIAANKQFETIIYPDRSHSIGDVSARYHLFQAMTNFIIDNL